MKQKTKGSTLSLYIWYLTYICTNTRFIIVPSLKANGFQSQLLYVNLAK